MSIEIKSPEQLRKMRAAGLVVAEGLRRMQEATAVGVTTAEIDAVGRDVLAEHGATSNFLGYGSEYGTPFPGVSCISVNDELVHGIPGNRVIRDGDLVSIDFGAALDGWHGGAARRGVPACLPGAGSRCGLTKTSTTLGLLVLSESSIASTELAIT